MFSFLVRKLSIPILYRTIVSTQVRKCHSVFGIKDLIQPEKLDQYCVMPVTCDHYEVALDVIKKYYLSEHVFVKSRHMDLSNDRALDEYLIGLLKQGHSMFVNTEDGYLAGLCVALTSSAEDPKTLRSYAFYRQDPNTKDFLYFLAKLVETPNLWDLFHQEIIFEIKMLAILPEYRRQGLAVMLTEKCKEMAREKGLNLLRMDCINPYDYKIAERCMLQCLVKYPLHKLRGTNTPYIRKSSRHNRFVRVYVETRAQSLSDREVIKEKQSQLESQLD